MRAAAPDAVMKPAGRDEPIESIVARFAKSRARDIGRDTTIDELGLSSLERVELLMALEDRFQTTIDEAAYAEVKTVGDFDVLVSDGSSRARSCSCGRRDGCCDIRLRRSGRERPAPRRGHLRGARHWSGSTAGRALSRSAEPVVFPSWNRTLPARQSGASACLRGFCRWGGPSRGSMSVGWSTWRDSRGR